MDTTNRSLSRRRLLGVSASVAAIAATSGRVASSAWAAQSAPAIPNTLASDASPQFRAVAGAAMQALADLGIPGAAVGIYHDGRSETAVFGKADVEAEIDVTPETRFGIGSISKTYTVTGLMRLMEAGELELEARVRDYLPDLRLADESVAEELTVKHLLTHTGDWYGDRFVDLGDDDDAIARFVADELPLQPQVAPLGRFFSYNNSGFVLLGHLLETLVGKPWRDAVAELVQAPLELTQATADPAAVRRGPHGVGYAGGADPAIQVTPLFLPRYLDPTGGLWTTIENQLRYARFHLGLETTTPPILSAETLSLMKTPQVPFPEVPALSIGMNWAITEVEGHRVAAHNGATFSQNAATVLIPDMGFTFVMLTNASTGGAALAAVQKVAFAEYLGIGAVAGGVGGGAGVADDASAAHTPDDLAEYAGEYTNSDSTFTISPKGDGLNAEIELHFPADTVTPSNFEEPPSSAPLAFTGPDRAAIGSDAEPVGICAFLRDTDNSLGWMSFGNRLLRRTESA